MRVKLPSILFFVVLAGVSWLGFAGADVVYRGALWHVVQACLINHRITGSAFPCLAVETDGGYETGYAVLRSPVDQVKIIVTPTVRTIGIEAERLRGAHAPNYFQDAWNARRFATAGLATDPGDENVALALNSKPGRSQDQLHIHVACVATEVKTSLVHSAELIRSTGWTRLKILPGAPSYQVLFVPGDDLSGVNVIDLAAAGTDSKPTDMDKVTIVVVRTAKTSKDPAGFTILARRRIPHSRDAPHGEFLLDQDCDS